MPGTKADICVNDKEIKSRVPDGGKTSKVMVSGFKTIKIFKKDPRKCRGAQVPGREIGPDGHPPRSR